MKKAMHLITALKSNALDLKT